VATVGPVGPVAMPVQAVNLALAVPVVKLGKA